MTKKTLTKEERERFSILVKNWYNSQTRFKIDDIALELGIPHASMYDYLKYGVTPDVIRANAIIKFIKSHPIEIIHEKDSIKPIKGMDTKPDIREETVNNQIYELNDLLNSLHSSIENIQSRISSKKTPGKISQNDELSYHTNNFKSALFSLYSELNWFKNQTKKERNILRKHIGANDIGYLTSLLRAIIKGEDFFGDWVLATNYQMEMLKWQKPR